MTPNREVLTTASVLQFRSVHAHSCCNRQLSYRPANNDYFFSEEGLITQNSQPFAALYETEELRQEEDQSPESFLFEVRQSSSGGDKSPGRLPTCVLSDSPLSEGFPSIRYFSLDPPLPDLLPPPPSAAPHTPTFGVESSNPYRLIDPQTFRVNPDHSILYPAAHCDIPLSSDSPPSEHPANLPGYSWRKELKQTLGERKGVVEWARGGGEEELLLFEVAGGGDSFCGSKTTTRQNVEADLKSGGDALRLFSVGSVREGRRRRWSSPALFESRGPAREEARVLFRCVSLEGGGSADRSRRCQRGDKGWSERNKEKKQIVEEVNIDTLQVLLFSCIPPP
eukprot:GHVS01025922.1.p1 GENE.GHVS01025922.1~~GHVS01025922.1.p1  ORF type:complete len:338 (+),score=74.11 GHVS01025922.1:140-1153(+)